MKTKRGRQLTRIKTGLHHWRGHQTEDSPLPAETQPPSKILESSSESAETCILETSHSDSDDPDVPPLTRTESVFLNKEYLEQVLPHPSDSSISCIKSSGDEYIPSKASVSGGSAEEPDSPVSKSPVVKRKTSQRTYKRKKRPRTSSDKDKKRRQENCDDTTLENVSVMKLQKQRDGARVYSKRHYSLYCPMHCHKMARHLICSHSNEPAVAKAISFPLNSKERKLHFDLIRNKGNRAHNNEVLKTGSGTLIPSQQTAKPVKASDYMHCINCEALLKRKTLWMHMSRCRLSLNCSMPKPDTSRIQAVCAYAQPVPDGVSQNVLELTNAMHQDEVTNNTNIDDNPYFFARAEAESHLRGSDAIRQMAKECGAKHPETLSSTKLRKQVSTLSTVLNLKDNEMDTLANFLGHDIRVHRQYYRLPEGTLELAKVSKVLIALEQGRLSDYKGMSLDEIQIDPSEQVLEAVDSDLSETKVDLDSSFCSASSSSKKRRQPVESDSDDPQTASSSSKKRQPVESDGDDPQTASSSSKKRRQPVESDSDDPQTASWSSKKRRRSVESDGEDPQTLKGSSKHKTRLKPVETGGDSKRGTSKKRSWSPGEIRAVEKTLNDFIESGKVPGKSECKACIKASPEALRNRSWTAVKFYVKKRITANQRQSAKRFY